MQYTSATLVLAAFAASVVAQDLPSVITAGGLTITIPSDIASLSIPSVFTTNGETISVPSFSIPTDPAALSTFCQTIMVGTTTSSVGPGCTSGSSGSGSDNDNDSTANDASSGMTSTGGAHAARETGWVAMGGAAAMGVAAMVL